MAPTSMTHRQDHEEADQIRQSAAGADVIDHVRGHDAIKPEAGKHPEDHGGKTHAHAGKSRRETGQNRTRDHQRPTAGPSSFKVTSPSGRDRPRGIFRWSAPSRRAARRARAAVCPNEWIPDNRARIACRTTVAARPADSWRAARSARNPASTLHPPAPIDRRQIQIRTWYRR